MVWSGSIFIKERVLDWDELRFCQKKDGIYFTLSQVKCKLMHLKSHYMQVQITWVYAHMYTQHIGQDPFVDRDVIFQVWEIN